MSHPQVDLNRLRKLSGIRDVLHDLVFIEYPDLAEFGKRLGVFDGARLLRDHPAEVECLMDLCRYGVRGRRPSVMAQKFKSEHLLRWGDTWRVRQGMLSSWFSIFRVTRVARYALRMRDQITQKQITVVDEQLFRRVQRGDLVAGRLLDMDGYAIAAGPVYPVTPQVAAAALKKFRAPRKSSSAILSPGRQRRCNEFVAIACIADGSVREAVFTRSEAILQMLPR